MKKASYSIYNNDFLRGELDSALYTIGGFSLNSSDIVPMANSILKEADMKLVISRIPQFPFIVSKWLGVVGANGRRVVIRIDDSNAESTRNRKRLVQDRIYSLLYSKLKYKKLESSIIELVAREGCAIVRFKQDGVPVVDSHFRYNIYWNELEKVARYAYKDPKTGTEIPALSALYEGKDIYVIRHPSFQSWILPLSPVETILMIARLEFHATVANQKIFDQGMIGQVFLQLAKEILPDVKESLMKDKDDKANWFSQLMRRIRDKNTGVRNANKIDFMPGLEGAVEIGKTSKDMQFAELLNSITPSRIAWNWLLTPADFGIGGATTYNNVSTFDDSLYDKFGRLMCEQLDQMTNEWLLPAYNITTSESLYVEYVQPEDPKKLEQLKEAREDVKAGLMTTNEYREIKGLPPIDGGDAIGQQTQLPQQFNVVDVVQPTRYRQIEPDFFR